MLKREDLIGKNAEELPGFLEANIAEYAAVAETYETEEEVLEKEKEIVKLMEENDSYLRTVTYKIPEGATFDGQLFGKKVLCEYIVDFLNTQELEWSYSLGMFELVKLWKTKDLEEINYHAFDSTLRILGQCKYRGYDAWRKILAVNEFLKQCHDDYVRDTSYMLYLSQLHNKLIDALKKFNPEVDTQENSEENQPA